MRSRRDFATITSIRQRLYTLDPDNAIIPGRDDQVGPWSTVRAEERRCPRLE